MRVRPVVPEYNGLARLPIPVRSTERWRRGLLATNGTIGERIPGYEPLGVYHENTHFLEDSEVWFTNHGPIGFVDEQMNVTMIRDWKFFADQQ
jgi:hypothetical protein